MNGNTEGFHCCTAIYVFVAVIFPALWVVCMSTLLHICYIATETLFFVSIFVVWWWFRALIMQFFSPFIPFKKSEHNYLGDKLPHLQTPYF